MKFEELKDFAPNFSSSCRLYLPERVRSRSPREMDMEAIVGGLFCMVLLFAIFPLIWYKRRRSLRDEDLHRDEEVEPLVTVIVHSFFGVFYIIIPSICENFRPMFSSCCSSIWFFFINCEFADFFLCTSWGVLLRRNSYLGSFNGSGLFDWIFLFMFYALSISWIQVQRNRATRRPGATRMRRRPAAATTSVATSSSSAVTEGFSKSHIILLLYLFFITHKYVSDSDTSIWLNYL